MNLIKRVYPFLFSLIALCQSCTNSFTQEKAKIRKEIQVSEFINPTRESIEKFDSLIVVFNVGFIEIQKFKIFIDNKLVKTFSGKTNESIGLCFLENGSLCCFNMLQREIKSDSKLLIEINNEYVELVFPTNVQRYNRLYIGRYERWEASFEVYNDSFPNEYE